MSLYQKITSDMCEKALEMIAEGESLQAAADELRVSKSGLHKNILKNHEEDYFMALQIRSSNQVDEMMQYRQELIAGGLEHNVFNALLAQTKWQAGKEFSKIYGEKKELSVNRSIADVLDEIDDVGDDAVSTIEDDHE